MIITFDIGGTEIKWGLFENGNITHKSKFKTPKTKRHNTIVEELCKIIDQYPTLEGITISTAGVVKEGKVIYASQNIPGYTGTNLKFILEKKYSVPVEAFNDANCAIYAETKFGSMKEHSNVIGYTIGTGIGAGIVINNKIFEGETGRAGEIANIKVNGLEIEANGSTTALVEKCGVKNGIEIFDNIEKHKNTLEEFYNFHHDVVDFLSTIYDIKNVVIGGGIVSNKLFEIDKIKCGDVNLKKAIFGNDAGLYGAYALFSMLNNQK